MKRYVYINDNDLSQDLYCDNRISNRKYTLLNFLPKNLWEQFSRFMNQYFLLIACLQLWALITPVNPASTWGPLIFIFAVSATKEAWDDYNRYLSDKQANEKEVWVVKHGTKKHIQAQDIHVGDIIWLRENDEVPCDLVLIGTSDPQGICYVETATLDGETDLKTRVLPPACMGLDPELLHKIKGVIECPSPDKDIRRFDANMRLFPPFIDNDVCPLTIKNTLLQSCYMRNTEWACGVAVYTGNETKLGMSRGIPEPKLTAMDAMIDKLTGAIFLFQIVVVIVLGIAGNVWKDSEARKISQSHSAEIGPFTLVGKRTTIGDHSIIANSVIGEGCIIGSKVSIEGSYIWDNVTIQDGCTIKNAIVCDGVVINSGAVLEPGVILSYKVIIGQQFVVPAYSKVSTLPQPTKQDSDEELEYAESSGDIGSPSTATVLDTPNGEFPPNSSEVGISGVGYIWSACEGAHEEEWRHSIAPVPADKLAQLRLAVEAETDLLTQDSNIPPSGELKPDSEIAYSEDADIEYFRDDSADFEKEVEATFLRAVHEGVEKDHVIIEVNSLRLSYNVAFADCAGAIFYSVMKLALETPYENNSQISRNVASVIAKWGGLLKHYLQTIDEEIEVIMKFEEMCLESCKEFSPLFAQILHFLYDKDILKEEAILSWADEKEGADESDKIFVNQSENFIQWLKEAEEDDDDEEND